MSPTRSEITKGAVRSGGVVMISPNFYPHVGGAEKQALELSKAVEALGVQVVVLTRRIKNLPSVETAQGISVRRLRAWGGGLINSTTFMVSSFLWLLLKSPEYRAIHVHLAGSPALSAVVAGKMLNKRVVIKLGGGRGIGEIAASRTTWAGRLKLKLLAALKPQFVAVIDELVDELRRHGLGGAPVLVIPNGVDTRRYRPASAEAKTALRSGLGLSSAPCFLYVGRLAEEKRLPPFLEIFAEALRESKKDGTLILVGSGPEEDALRSKAAALGLSDRVRFEAPTPDIERYYGAADVFVLPSISEGLSNALLEAMSSGLGILASRVGGMKEAVEDGVSGLLFEPESRLEMKEKLLRFLQEPALAQKLGEAARRIAIERYDLGVVAKRYIELYGF